jgi:hypothetical protein
MEEYLLSPPHLSLSSMKLRKLCPEEEEGRRCNDKKKKKKRRN